MNELTRKALESCGLPTEVAAPSQKAGKPGLSHTATLLHTQPSEDEIYIVKTALETAEKALAAETPPGVQAPTTSLASTMPGLTAVIFMLVRRMSKQVSSRESNTSGWVGGSPSQTAKQARISVDKMCYALSMRDPISVLKHGLRTLHLTATILVHTLYKRDPMMQMNPQILEDDEP